MPDGDQSRAPLRSVGRALQTGLVIAAIVAVTTGVVGGLYKLTVAVERLITTIDKDAQATDKWRASMERQAEKNLELHEKMTEAIVDHEHRIDTIERLNINHRQPK